MTFAVFSNCPKHLVVKIIPGSDKYELISGERRYHALKLLVERGVTRYSHALCKVETEQDETLTELKLIMANMTARELSPSEKTNQAERLFKILQELKEKGAKLSGRRREIVAKMLNISPAQVGRMEHISNNLIPEAKAEFEKGNLDMTAAYETSRLPAEKQSQVVDDIRQGVKVGTKAVKEKRDKSAPPPNPVPVEPPTPPEFETAPQPTYIPELDLCPLCGKELTKVTYEENRIYRTECKSCKTIFLHESTSYANAVLELNRRHSG